MSGSGSLTKTGTGTLILSGTNGYGGGTTVSAGILQGNTTSLQGNILNNALVVFNQTAAGTYAGTMSGTGGLTLQGNGVLNLTGSNTYTGGTTVRGGTLAVNGSLASSVTVGPGGTLGGNGTITGTGRQRRHPGARQLDRHAQHQRQLHAGRRRHLPGRGQCGGPGRPHQCHRHGGDPRRHGAGAGPARQLRQQHDLYDPARHRRRLGHLLPASPATSPS